MNEDIIDLLAGIVKALEKIVGQLEKLNLAVDALIPEQETKEP